MTFSLIYADPPWNYRVWSKKGKGRAAENHYPTMKLEDIQSIRVASIAAADSALFLWVTMPNLIEGIDTMKAWGFEYKTCAFAWVKTTSGGGFRFGLGYYTRANVELCLLGTRGRLTRQAKNVRQLIVAPSLEHSAKPPQIRDRIVSLFGDLPRVELFARPPVPPGWTGLGRDIDGRDISDAIAGYDDLSLFSQEAL